MNLRSIAYLCVLLGLTLAGLSGCSVLPGSSEFKCKAPDGVPCMAVEEAYKRSLSGGFKTAQDGETSKTTPDREDAATKPVLPYRAEALRTTPSSGDPIRSQPRVMRVWIAPWEDKEGDLHDQSYLWVTVNGGSWLLEHTKRQVQQAFRPVVAPASSGKPTIPASAPSSSFSGQPGQETTAPTSFPMPMPFVRPQGDADAR
ncbi:MAG: type IV conjugative transfer system lipoprotein TraV [Pseudomonadota bacterium]|nr:type IV conjugative transfer system lipoprotein TraV [Pseudomonadota bacterium]